LSADGKRLRFLESHHRKQSAELSAREVADQEYRLTSVGYDGRTAVLTLEEIAHLPALRPVTLATIPKRIRRQSVRNGKVKVLVSNGVPVLCTPVVSIEIGREVQKVEERVEVPKAA
jgi:hypothetical protein